MDEEVIIKMCEGLEQSLSNNNQIRKEAENYVYDAMEWNGF